MDEKFRRMNKEREWLLRDKYRGIESPEFFIDLKRIEDGEPVDYVIGLSTLLGCRIDLSLRPLIPRTETEYWVEKAITVIQNSFGVDAELRFLDVFAGSGCIGIALLKQFPNAYVDFADIDDSALKQIQKNLELNSIDPSRYAIYKSDVFADIPVDKKYDAIFANPPYISKASKEKMTDSVLEYEPHQALFSGEDGLDLIRTMFKTIRPFLSDTSYVFLEHDDEQVSAIESILKSAQFTAYEFHKDQFGLSRWVRIKNFPVSS